MSDKIKIAAAQIEPRLMKIDENLNKILAAAKEAANKSADLVVFPECCLTGYIFASRQEAMPFAESIPGPSSQRVGSLCQELNLYIVFGLLERDNGKLFNAAVLTGPQGVIWRYRKNHLPFQGIDRFVDLGNEPFRVYQTTIGNIGLQICYDIVFPESSRVMTLLGADIIVLSTNFAKRICDNLAYVINTRAIENKVHVVSCNRVGVERGNLFGGLSKIVDASGHILAVASPDREEIIYGEVRLESARQKRSIFSPGEFEVDQINDRRPELYGLITKPKLGRERD